MSECLVEVCQIDKILPHSNAQKLEIATIKGWQCVVPKKQFAEGEKVVYFPPDTCIPESVSEKLGVTGYLGKGGRIKSIKLRGEPSFGLVIKLEDQGLEVGSDVSSKYEAKKYEPPPVFTAGGQNRPARKPKSWLGRFIQKYTWKLFNVPRQTAEEVPGMPKYTDIENLRNHNRVFEAGEEVSVSEKIHGCLCGDSLVTTKRGAIRIADVKPGEMAMSYDQYANCFVWSEVNSVVSRKPSLGWVRLAFDNGSSLVCTKDHLLLTENRGWISAEHINHNDVLIEAEDVGGTGK